jgi:hypothetical protein
MVSNVPLFTQTIQSNSVSTTLANTSRTAPTNGVTCYTAGASGSLVNTLLIKWNTTSAAGLIFLFTYDGSTYRLFGEYPTTIAAVSSTVPGLTLQVSLNWLLKSGSSFYVTNYLAEGVSYHCNGSDY